VTPEFNAQAMADKVLAELAEARGDITLAIDDLHELTSPEALGQLTRLLTKLPPRTHAVLTSRRDVPRLRLHRLRLAGELTEIRAADLRFSERETRELLEASGIALSAAGAALLHQRTEGWAAGRDPGPAAAHLPAGPGQRRAGGPAHRPAYRAVR
jgi:LuxR family maltose regulon positive regulatory protein